MVQVRDEGCATPVPDQHLGLSPSQGDAVAESRLCMEAARADPGRSSHEGLWMLDSVLRESDSFEFFADTFCFVSSSSAESSFGICLCLLEPLATSDIHFRWIPGLKILPSSSRSDCSRSSIWSPTAVEVHRNKILLHFKIQTKKDMYCTAQEEFFVFDAAPKEFVDRAPSLPVLMRVPFCGHTMIGQHNTGILLG